MTSKLKWILVGIVLIFGIGLVSFKSSPKSLTNNLSSKMALIITSPYFENNNVIPPQFTCDGADVFPELLIKNLPKETQSLAISVEDPDAPFKTFIHLIAFIPFATDKIDEEILNQSILGINDFGSLGRRGPCPPPGDKPHRYFFKIWALKDRPSVSSGFNHSYFIQLIQSSSVFNSGQLIGTYSRRSH